MTRSKGIEKAKVIQIIQTTLIIGEGTEKDPTRYIYQYWDFKGNLLASHDTLNDNGVTFSR